MTQYLARTENQFKNRKEPLLLQLRSNERIDEAFSKGYEIIRRDESGDTVIAKNGEWLEVKPCIQNYAMTESSPSELMTQVRQMSADLAYISMMTGVEL